MEWKAYFPEVKGKKLQVNGDTKMPSLRNENMVLTALDRNFQIILQKKKLCMGAILNSLLFDL